MAVKLCPKCNAAMTRASLVCALPAALTPSSSKAVSADIAVKLLPYLCPRCQYVELYHYEE
jgi:hypothetical protein